uniref:Phosphatase and actin regulator 4 n=2 Tax=Anthurium amnicola TaxID=1678845 RepID=A0A1D1YT36_9ARAE
MPLTSGTLRRLIKSRHPNVDRLAGSVVGVIRNSIGNAASFEIVSEQLKKGHLEAAADEGVNDDVESPPVRGEHASAEAGTSQIEIVDGADSLGRTEEAETSVVHRVGDPKPGSSSVTGSPIEPCIRVAISSEEKMGHGLVLPLQSVKAVNVASIQVLKKPTGAFGALFWNSSNKRKLDPDPKGRKVERDKADVKLEQIKSSVTLPFHSFAGSVGESRFGSDRAMTHAKPQHPEPLTHQELEQRLDVKVEDIIALTNESEDPQSSPETPSGGDSSRHRGWFPELLQNGSAAGSGVEMNMTVEPMSLAELSSSFRKCLPTEQTRRRKDIQKEGTVVPLQPFDYAAGRKEVRFGDGQDRQSLAEDDDSLRASISVKGRRKGSAPGRVRGEERADFQPPRRCQAFPASGNRSATFH